MKLVVVVLVALLASLQYRLWFGDGSLQELWRVREEARETRAEVLALRGRNQALRAEVSDLKSGLDAIEERARTDLGMIDPDETFYQFVRAPEARPGGGTGKVGGGGTEPGEAQGAGGEIDRGRRDE